MGMFSSVPPNLADAPKEYAPGFVNQLNSTLRTYFNRLNAVQNINMASANFNLDTLPTQADVATLRAGDVYRDTTASNVLKVKV